MNLRRRNTAKGATLGCSPAEWCVKICRPPRMERGGRLPRQRSACLPNAVYPCTNQEYLTHGFSRDIAVRSRTAAAVDLSTDLLRIRKKGNRPGFPRVRFRRVQCGSANFQLNTLPPTKHR